MRRKFIHLILVFLSSLLLAACSSKDSSKKDSSNSEITSKIVSGMASKGPINGGTVKVYALNADGTKGNQLGETDTTASDGSYSIDIGDYTGNVLVQVSGGTYTDEATNRLVTNDIMLSAALTGVSESVSVAVTPLTDIAVKYAGTLTETKIEEANYLVSVMVGVDIINTMPVDVTDQTAAAAATVDGIAYGLALASISQMMDTKGSNVSTVIDAIGADLSDGQLDATGGDLSSALTVFLGSDNNETGVATLDETKLDDAIAAIETTAVNIPSDVDLSDLSKAKLLVADLRNTALSIYNYQDDTPYDKSQDAGAPEGIFDTPFKNLAEEFETTIEPELTYALDRLGWIIEAADSIDSMLPGTSETFIHPDYNLLTLALSKSPDGTTVTFTVEDEDGPADSGTITTDVEIAADFRPTTGTVVGTLKTPNGTLSVNLNYTGTKNSSGQYTAMTFTGSMAAPGGLSLDFSQAGRKISVTWAATPETDPNIPDIYADIGGIYPATIFFSGRITTGTAHMDGTLDISSIKWADKWDSGTAWAADPNGFWQEVDVCTGAPVPEKATFVGSFSELQNGAATGVKFSGTLTGNWTNAETYDGCAGDSATNVAQWDATFDGKIEAPSRPTITAFLKVAQSEYRKYALDVSYTRTNTDGSVVSLSGSGTATEIPYVHDSSQTYTVIEASLANQNGLVVDIIHEGSHPTKFTGTIKTSGGTLLADLYLLEGAPTVKYTDDSFESIF